MKIPRFWVSVSGRVRASAGSNIPLKAFGWSDVGVDEAKARATESLARLMERVSRGLPFPERYAYAGRPVREEILLELPAAAGEPRGIVTRNAYGALVLNTDSIMFVDVDDKLGIGVALRSLVSKLFNWRRESVGRFPGIPPAVAAFASAHLRWAIRCYKTHAGWRLLVVHDVFDPVAIQTRETMKSLGADPKYVELTRIQESFRARLTPKPWRCGVGAAPRTFPRESPAQEAAHVNWLATYNAASAGFATCRYVTTLGSGSPSAAARTIVDHHDAETKAHSVLPLA